MGSLRGSVLEGVEGVYGLCGVYTALMGKGDSFCLFPCLGCERMKRLHVFGKEVSLEMKGVGR